MTTNSAGRSRAGAGAVRRWGVVLGLVLVPLLIVGSLGWVTASAESRRPTVRAAIVNHDVPVTIQGQLAPMGRQLSAALVKGPAQGTGYTWVLSDDSDAAAGLASGRYVARVVIPEDFSAAATSYGGAAKDAHQARIDVTTSSITGVADAEIARQLADAAARSLNSTLTQGYLDQVYLGFNRSADGMRQLASGTSDLADGAAQLSGGVGSAHSGSVQLADGLAQLKAGTAQLPAQTAQLAAGSRQVSDGMAQLSGGLGQLSAGADQLSGGASTYAAGVKQYTDGVGTAADGAAQISAGIDQLSSGLDSALPSPEQLAQIQKVIDRLRPVLDQITAALKDMQGTADRLSAGTGAVVKGLDTTVSDLTALSSGAVTCPADIAAQGQAACDGWKAGVKQGADRALALLTTKDPRTGYSVVTAAKAADTAATSFQELVRANGGTLPGLDPAQIDLIMAALTDLPGQVAQLQTGVHQLNDGAAQLSGGLAQLKANGPALVDGAGQLATGGKQLADGAAASAAGATRLSSGAAQLADGTQQLAAGMVPLSSGIAQSADGGRQLADGMGRLADGAAQLAAGTDQLARGVSDNVSAIPTYTDAERQNLAAVVASPVATDGSVVSATPVLAAGALIAVIALWFGTLATYVLRRAVPTRLLGSTRSTPWLLARTVGPGVGIAVVQAVGIALAFQAVTARAGTGLSFGRAAAVLGVLVLGGVMFALVHHALVAWGGNVGRAIALLMAVLTLAAGVTSAVPAFFDTVRPLLALSPVLDAVRAAVTGGSVGGPLLGILAWALLGAVAGGLAVMRERRVGVAQFVRTYA
ncbi:YhgE/Pip domain-containing protein [Raineyella sp.]|uniref:YhgE/Pip domain-containing protein n=1 Tax=Raineyella sp. TaxID=1911550 RepID=UPI002B210C31|nr:YhgE/Pip domain-containing protein [Raineyella sp.]MEA5153210.1 YhgE/Pip domain-containing protein [Raineyella sp.]